VPPWVLDPGAQALKGRYKMAYVEPQTLVPPFQGLGGSPHQIPRASLRFALG
jgi:hypothetical protein